MNNATPMLTLDIARQRLRKLGFHGLLAQAETLLHEPWLAQVIDIEDAERASRSLKRRLADARLGAFKPRAGRVRAARHPARPPLAALRNRYPELAARAALLWPRRRNRPVGRPTVLIHHDDHAVAFHRPGARTLHARTQRSGRVPQALRLFHIPRIRAKRNRTLVDAAEQLRRAVASHGYDPH